MSDSTRVAYVSGAAQGIGLKIALRLADDGLDVAVNDIPSKQAQLEEVVSQIKAKGRRAIAVPGDVSVEEDVRSMIDKVAAELGGLDVLVANAGLLLVKAVQDIDAEEWDRVMAVNIRGTMLQYKYAARQMIKQGRGGRILGASSVAGKRGWGGISAYSASKFAVRGLTQCLSIELAKHNITVNCYAPGIVVTQMALDLGAGLAAIGMPAEIPVGDPESVSSIVSYLVKPEASFITGQSISPNGGAVLD
ncbi:NAD(P)-binding protein [Daedalea quercina L-15889]|uniref:NAD(P)-binding protein n=1 Tax=Daedalea quercina L-15889 TaxID=1314783 RepID=A0A165R762_9APHY|nr:NAD(P)-binding protein [Daedalea quercina L-15889]